MSESERTIVGELISVSPMGGVFTIHDDHGEQTFRLIDSRYWDRQAPYRAYKALLRLKKLVGRRVCAAVEHHSAFGDAAFGGSAVRLADKAGKRR